MFDDLPAPSSLMSSRWSRDNLVTGHPPRLYSGGVIERITQESLERLIQDLERKTRRPIQVGPGRMGVLTWDISCTDDDGPFVLQVPLVLDERGRRDRARRDVPRLNLENMRYFTARGLTRFVPPPRELVMLSDDVQAAMLGALPDHHPLLFGRGSLHVELADGELSWLVSLGPHPTADLLAEMIAALVYHYDPELEGGTAVTDVCVNDGDFVARRRPDGGFDVRLTAARRREGGIGTNLLLLYLVQLMTYEDWSIDGDLVGLPVLISNPSVAFDGVVRGLRYRYQDLGQPEALAQQESRRWIRDFARSREGRAYRPWVERFLAGHLPPSFGDDPRERWWRLTSLQTKLNVLELRARQDHSATTSAADLRTFLDRLSREIGHVPKEDPAAVRINDLGRDGLLDLLEQAQIPADSRAGVADDVLTHWPFRSLDHLLALAPGARPLRRIKSRISFGTVVPDEDQGTLNSLGPAPRAGDPTRALANPELFGALSLPPSLHATAARTFPTFEAYMDAALHDSKWGYYAHNVLIGRAGHFDTNPEDFSPHYGRWTATLAFRFWRDMIARGELSETDQFPVIEFGAGNGRLARDFLDAVARDDRWRTFASRVEYRIYETSASLRDKQRRLLGTDAIVAEGDARRPEATVMRDFPAGVRGVVFTNEVPDAFGVHKVVLAPEGRALAALVVPRVEDALRAALSDDLSRRITDADGTVRHTLGLRGNTGDLYLDGGTYAAVMEALVAFPTERREVLLSALWFEEAYVSASAIPELAAHLRANAAQYATALAAEGSGVVLYVNVHADRFIRELGSSIRAGFIVTVDYGDTTWGLVQGARRGEFPFRVYGDHQDYQPRPNDPYAAPGTQDLTADVNFTALARAGQEAGLEVIHFGPERDVTGDDLPALLRDTADRESIAEFLGNPVFKLLVLGTRPSDVFSGPLISPVPLCRREQDIPKARRQRIAAIQHTLSSLDGDETT
jgi:SAM-dependent MidA family methyltransferase